jgi:hypothetical protein
MREKTVVSMSEKNFDSAASAMQQNKCQSCLVKRGASYAKRASAVAKGL